MTKAEVLAWIRRTKIVPVVRAQSTEEAIVAATALVDGGIDILEITMTVPGAVDVIRELTNAFGNRALVGAGTVLDAAVAAECVEAGARFIVSPALNVDTVTECGKMGVPVAPGALTPTEVLAAWCAGADVVKVFPCEAVGGASYIKALKGPFPDIPLMPTGGVTLENIKTFLAAGACAVGVGSNLVDVKLVREGRIHELVERAKAFREAVTA